MKLLSDQGAEKLLLDKIVFLQAETNFHLLPESLEIIHWTH